MILSLQWEELRSVNTFNMYIRLYYSEKFQLIKYMVCDTTFFQLRDHYLEAERCGHATKCAWPLFFHLVNQINDLFDHNFLVVWPPVRVVQKVVHIKGFFLSFLE